MLRIFQLVITATFVAFTLAQGATYALGSRAGRFENRRLAELPAFEWDALADGRVATGLSDYLRDRMPLRARLVALHNRAVFTLFGDSPVDDVRVGRDGWLFLRRTLEDWPCGREARGRAVLPAYAAFVRAAEGAGRLPVIALSPDKASLYPEQLSPRDRTRFDGCAAPRQAALEQKLARVHPDTFVNLWSLMRAEKRRLLERTASTWTEERLRYLYRPRDRHWHWETGRLQAGAIAGRIAPGVAFDAAWPAQSSEYLPAPSEMSLRFLQFVLPEPYAALEPAATAPVLQVAEFDDTRETIRSYTREGAPDPRRVVLFHDSFMQHSELFLAASFAHTDFVHWEIVKKKPVQARRRLMKADVIVLQMVESHRGIWAEQVRWVARQLERARAPRSRR